MAKHKLNAQKLAKEPRGKYCDGHNLWCHKDSQDVGRWIFRYQLHGESHSIGLGSMQAFSLKEAREKADRLYKLQKSGIDPLGEKRASIAQRKADAAKALTFKECAQQFIEANRAEWRSARHEEQWVNSLKKWAFPIVGAIPVQVIDTPLVLKVLEQKVDGASFWERRPETATRVRGRIENVLGWAATRGYRSADNPARWEAHLEHSLPLLTKAQAVKHFPALPYSELPVFAAALRTQTDAASRALEYAILVAARPGEALGLTWGDVDLNARLIVIPGHRMKSHREHRIPLPPASRVLEILEDAHGAGDKSENDPVFTEAHNRPLGDHALRQALKRLGYSNVTVHGFRSCFKDWCTEQTSYPNEMSELALAHRTGSAVELAYRRGDLLKRRYQMMADWSSFVCSVAQAEQHTAAA